MQSIFDFWRSVPEDAHQHPADAEVLARVKDHGFQLGALPGQWMGPLATARVVFLYLSPGFAPFDIEFAGTAEGRRWHSLQRTGQHHLPDGVEHEPAYRWWASRARAYGTLEFLRDKVAFANIGAYHSKHFTDAPLLAALPSSRAMLDWAQGVLFPEARRGERLVVCMRATRFWGLEIGWSEGSLFAPQVTRGGFLHHGPVREQIEARARAILNRK